MIAEYYTTTEMMTMINTLDQRIRVLETIIDLLLNDKGHNGLPGEHGTSARS